VKSFGSAVAICLKPVEIKVSAGRYFLLRSIAAWARDAQFKPTAPISLIVRLARVNSFLARHLAIAGVGNARL